jgi:hypothetical protein
METSDFLNINPDIKSKESLEEIFEKERLEWTEKINQISLKMKNIFEISELMTYLYTERQRAVDYYHYLMSWLIKMNRNYNKSYAEKWDYYTTKTQFRYPNETSKNNRIHVELADIIEKRSHVDNHSKFILSTIQTIDNIIFAIPKRIEIEQISRGK